VPETLTLPPLAPGVNGRKSAENQKISGTTCAAAHREITSPGPPGIDRRNASQADDWLIVRSVSDRKKHACYL